MTGERKDGCALDLQTVHNSHYLVIGSCIYNYYLCLSIKLNGRFIMKMWMNVQQKHMLVLNMRHAPTQ